MANYTFQAELVNGVVKWSPSPSSLKSLIRVGMVLRFAPPERKSSVQNVLLMFRDATPFLNVAPDAQNPPPGPPFIYFSTEGKPLDLIVHGPPSHVFPFDCAIITEKGLEGLNKAGDEVPVGPLPPP